MQTHFIHHIMTLKIKETAASIYVCLFIQIIITSFHAYYSGVIIINIGFISTCSWMLYGISLDGNQTCFIRILSSKWGYLCTLVRLSCQRSSSVFENTNVGTNLLQPSSLRIHPDSKVHWANMGPIWDRQDPGGPHVGPMNIVIWADSNNTRHILWWVGAETGFSWWITTGRSWWITKVVSLWDVCYLYSKVSAIWLWH